MLKYSRHTIFEKMIVTLLQPTLLKTSDSNSIVIYTALHFAIVRFQFSSPCELGGFTVPGKGCSELKSIFVSVWRGLTCIQVELYESEGQSYELCRSEKNPADNKKTDSSSTAILQQQCCTGSTNSSGAKVSRQNSFIMNIIVFLFLSYKCYIL